MWAKRKNLVAKILKCGTIRNETEYYLMNALASDVDNPMTELERQQIGVLLGAFEAKR